MKKFIIKAGIIGVLPFAILLIVYLVVPVNKKHYLRMYDYKCKVLESTNSPRIIFIGGSNIRMSLDSKRIKDSLNFNVVNYGLTAPIGLKYMIDDISLYVKKGDLLVFGPEWHQFYNLQYGTNEALSFIIRLGDYNKFQLLNAKQLISVCKGIPNYLKQNLWIGIKEHIRPDNINLYGRFNEFGDEVNHWLLKNNYKSIPNPITENFDNEFGEYFINRLNELQSKYTVVMIPPSCCNVAMKKWDKQVKEVTDFLKENGHPFIIDPDSCSFPEEYMYDSDYHLNKKGIDIRTSLVINALKQVISN